MYAELEVWFTQEYHKYVNRACTITRERGLTTIKTTQEWGIFYLFKADRVTNCLITSVVNIREIHYSDDTTIIGVAEDLSDFRIDFQERLTEASRVFVNNRKQGSELMTYDKALDYVKESEAYPPNKGNKYKIITYKL